MSIGRKKIELISKSAQETKTIAARMASKLKKGDILALSGELGSGKTCFTEGLALGLGISPQYCVVSPTFTLINEYPGRCKLYHIDVYRLNGPQELHDLGLEEMLSPDGVVVIEWAEKIKDILPEGAFWIKIEYVGENERKINIHGASEVIRQLAPSDKTEVG